MLATDQQVALRRQQRQQLPLRGGKPLQERRQLGFPGCRVLQAHGECLPDLRLRSTTPIALAGIIPMPAPDISSPRLNTAAILPDPRACYPRLVPPRPATSPAAET